VVGAADHSPCAAGQVPHTVPSNILTGWIDAPSCAILPPMPFVELSDDDLARAVLAARAHAYAHELHAKSNADSADARDAPDPHRDQARRFHALAKRLDEARRSRA
jgi:hypothetical protein